MVVFFFCRSCQSVCCEWDNCNNLTIQQIQESMPTIIPTSLPATAATTTCMKFLINAKHRKTCRIQATLKCIGLNLKLQQLTSCLLGSEVGVESGISDDICFGVHILNRTVINLKTLLKALFAYFLYFPSSKRVLGFVKSFEKKFFNVFFLTLVSLLL